MKNSINKEAEASSQLGYVVVEDLKQQEKVNDNLSNENSVLETSVGKNFVVSGMSTKWYFLLVPVKLQ